MFKVIKEKEDLQNVYDKTTGESTQNLVGIHYGVYSNDSHLGNIHTHQHGSIDMNLFNLGKPVADLEVVVNAIISALND